MYSLAEGMEVPDDVDHAYALEHSGVGIGVISIQDGGPDLSYH